MRKRTKNSPVKTNPLRETISSVQTTIRRLKKKQKHWKLYFYLTFFLPVFVIVLSIQVARTYVRIKLRDVGTNAPTDIPVSPVKKAPVAVPAERIELETFKPEMVVPEAVGVPAEVQPAEKYDNEHAWKTCFKI